MTAASPHPTAAPVSRETTGGGPGSPTPPAAAVSYFGAALPRVRAYADLLASDAVERGLIGPREVPRLWERHLLNCAVLSELVPHEAAVTDVGSGAGLPGLVLALVRPDLRVTLVEPLLRRSVFLEEAVEKLGLPSVVVVRARADEPSALDRAGSADVVTARAVAPLDRLAAWCLPLVRPGGVLLAMKGQSAAAELAGAAGAIAAAGGIDPEVLAVGQQVVEPATVVVRVVRDAGGGRQDRATRRKGRPR